MPSGDISIDPAASVAPLLVSIVLDDVATCE
jgi:hypothetical protein